MNIVFEIFWRFLGLGCISFGGPVAHLAYFRHHFVEKLQWLSDERYANIIALSQFLPGPGSSQTGFAIGYHRAGIAGGIAAFLGFTIPSFLLMWIFAKAQTHLSQSATYEGIIHSLKILALVVVADACYKMFNKFCRTKATQLLCLVSLCVLLNVSAVGAQIGIIFSAAIIGIMFKPFFIPQHVPAHSKLDIHLSTIEKTALFIFFTLLLSSPLWKPLTLASHLFGDFYQAGSLVFGGGHVVLPLLQEFIGEQITQEKFLAGYAGAQAVPGPMFSLASYLGATLQPENMLLGALIACMGIFLPGYLLIVGLFNNWDRLASRPSFASAKNAINAAVVGLLLCALYNPVFTSAINNSQDLAVAIFGWIILKVLSLHIMYLVAIFSMLGFLFF